MKPCSPPCQIVWCKAWGYRYTIKEAKRLFIGIMYLLQWSIFHAQHTSKLSNRAANRCVTALVGRFQRAPLRQPLRQPSWDYIILVSLSSQNMTSYSANFFLKSGTGKGAGTDWDRLAWWRWWVGSQSRSCDVGAVPFEASTSLELGKTHPVTHL